VIEDAPAGIAAGLAAGMSVWAVMTTHGPEELEGASRVVADPRGVLAGLNVNCGR
jgi:beta-phosphoglucomutase-like phosphatase (HAD superfamily)